MLMYNKLLLVSLFFITVLLIGSVASASNPAKGIIIPSQPQDNLDTSTYGMGIIIPIVPIQTETSTPTETPTPERTKKPKKPHPNK